MDAFQIWQGFHHIIWYNERLLVCFPSYFIKCYWKWKTLTYMCHCNIDEVNIWMWHGTFMTLWCAFNLNFISEEVLNDVRVLKMLLPTENFIRFINWSTFLNCILCTEWSGIWIFKRKLNWYAHTRENINIFICISNGSHIQIYFHQFTVGGLEEKYISQLLCCFWLKFSCTSSFLTVVFLGLRY